MEVDAEAMAVLMTVVLLIKKRQKWKRVYLGKIMVQIGGSVIINGRGYITE